MSDYDPDFLNSPDIKEYVISNCGEGACDACKKMDGVSFTRGQLTQDILPIRGCKNPICWCTVVAIFNDEGQLIAE
jgi:hypothetical protein